MHSGSCLCGAVTLTVAGSLPVPNFCHCRMCRKHSGHYFASTDVPRTALTITGAEKLTWFQSSEKGWGLQPSIHLNDEIVGKSQPGGFFYVDKPEGNYRVSTTTEVTNTVSFHLAKNETKYVKTGIAFGILVGRIKPEIVYPEQGRSDLTDMKYIGAR